MQSQNTRSSTTTNKSNNNLEHKTNNKFSYKTSEDQNTVIDQQFSPLSTVMKSSVILTISEDDNIGKQASHTNKP